MQNDKTILIKEYLHKVKAANRELNKKEALKDLLNRLYDANADTENIIDKITLVTEKTIVNIPWKDRLHKVIIEYENDLHFSLNDAKEQLAGYSFGEISRGETYNTTLIASDLMNWKVFAPNVDRRKDFKEDEVVRQNRFCFF